MARVNLLLKVCLDVTCLSLVAFPLLILSLAAKPVWRGFFCDDESIHYPLLKDTIPNEALYVICIVTPLLVISLGEFIINKKQLGCCHDVEVVFYRFRIPVIIFMWYRKFGIYLFGACVSQLLTFIGKYQIGRLRPHFIAACDPIGYSETCESNSYKYITQYECGNQNSSVVKEARLSFPSGHASFSAYTMIYLIIYLHYRMKSEINYLLKPFLQVLFVAATLYISLTRISDFKHHWSDVLFGWILGTLVAIVTAFFISDLPSKCHMGMGQPLCSSNTTQISNYNSCEREMEEGCTQNNK